MVDNKSVIASIRDNISIETQKAVHIEWLDLNHYIARLLTDILGKNIYADTLREEYYYWKISFPEPITPEELETLLVLTQASDYDRDANKNEDGFPIGELDESLCNKLMNKLLPFELSSSRADDNGVWFIGKDPNTVVDTDQIGKSLPNGLSLFAKVDHEPEYPGIKIFLKKPDGSDEMVCFAEFNSSKPDGKQVCIGAYAHNIDEPTYYASYHDDGSPSANV